VTSELIASQESILQTGTTAMLFT